MTVSDVLNEGVAMLEKRMLSGEPFTYGGLCAAHGLALNEDRTRVIDKTIQRLRRKGLIAFVREGRSTVWRPVAARQSKGAE